jgi:arsenite methyltransferase
VIRKNAMIKIEVFDPAMCCSTGVCGPSVDPVLPRFAADLEWLKSKGVQVERYNLAQEVGAFTGNPIVKTTLNSQGTKCLPLVLVDGEIVLQATYPTRKTLAGLVGVDYEPEPVAGREKADSSLVSIGGPSKIGGR